jgi:hypothetical protein
MHQAGVSVRPDALWSDHEWEEIGAPWEELAAPADTPPGVDPSVTTPPTRGVPEGSGAKAPTRSRAEVPGRPERGGPTRPGARALGSAARGVPARPGAVAPTRSPVDGPRRPARGGSSREGSRASAGARPAGHGGAAGSSRDSAGARSARPADAAGSSARPAPRAAPGQGVPGRRTVQIRGYGAERNLIYSSRRPKRRPSERPYERVGFKPDRVAMWAFLMGLLLVLIAAASAHAAV